MGHRLPVNQLNRGASLVRFIHALRRGAEAFCGEWNSVTERQVQPSSMNGDAYDQAYSAIQAMRKSAPAPLKPEQSAINAASNVISLLREKHLGVPRIGPSPDGGVGMSWELTSGGRVLEVDAVVLDWGKIEYREGFADADGFRVDTVLPDIKDLSVQLVKVLQAASSPSGFRPAH